ncbi:DUF4261 domain-containing protein [Ohtaekwangia kribbensis]|jgi:hypothetical protein|uniref:DUF4261 domain-containing protein n=1 Tax=Ohtaekwangia kribbensis TaxID=688913 RepID=A0ABW3K0E5_9BACT
MPLFNWGKKKNIAEEKAMIANEMQMLMVKLLFDKEPVWQDAILEQELVRNFPLFSSTDISGKDSDRSRQYFFRNYMVHYTEGDLPAQGTIFKPEKPFSQDTLTHAYRQAWHWHAAQEVGATCTHELMVTDLMALPLPYRDRVIYFQKFLSAVVKAMKPQALYFTSSDKLIDPAEYLKQIEEHGFENLYALLNVRLYNVTGSGMLMDSIGMHALGLPDFQIQFSEKDPGQIAGLLYSYAQYIYDYGSVIEDGNTVEGIEQGSRWKCIYSGAAVDPKRSVIDVKPSAT